MSLYVYNGSVADLRGCYKGAYLLNFHAVFAKSLLHNRLEHPSPELGHPLPIWEIVDLPL